ncbi:MAG: sulfite exporter TauE/SafE family protein [Candidatus Paralactobacillus gallistercoris]|uniref:Probable membrane transporter protein n=1 Tax=Candidatus Paralactobacillus gallistercoris TaxID=2838724 RepID=A0A948TJ12_9LACO|nr:sulfite exporter TauE/SafE family protein [Candidatus Paralactobacillus gallistercoris]
MIIKNIIYALIVIVATVAGSSTGLGGGVVIKPMFDLIGNLSTATVNFYSSLAVFVMAVVTIIRQIKKGFTFNFKVLLSVSGGAVIGGLIGQLLLVAFVHMVSPLHAKLIQSLLLCLMLVSVLLYSLNKHHIKTYHWCNLLTTLSLGLFLGIFSVFLGIGGGPINVALTMILFSFNMREAAVYSVGIIFFAQLTKLIMVLVGSGKSQINFALPTIIAVIIAAIIGGFVGTIINRRASDKGLNVIYNSMIIALIGVTIFNMLRVIF